MTVTIDILVQNDKTRVARHAFDFTYYLVRFCDMTLAF